MTNTPPSPTDFSDRPAELSIYKPNQRGNGGAIRFGLNPTKAAVFVVATHQSGDKQFDWDQKITMKWSLQDIGSVLSVLNHRCPSTKLFHQTTHANSAFEITANQDANRPPFFLTISRQDAPTKTLRRVALPINLSDAEILTTALQTAIIQILRW